MNDKDPTRCDPASAERLAATVETFPELDIDQRIRNVVAALVNEGVRPPAGAELSEEEMLLLEEHDDDLVLTGAQVADMTAESPPADLDGFVASLTPEELAGLKAMVGALEPPADPEPAPVQEPASPPAAGPGA